MGRDNLLNETLGDGESIVVKDPVRSGEGQDRSDGDVQRFNWILSRLGILSWHDESGGD